MQVEHFKAYVCKPPASTDKAVVVIHDIFAWQLPNTRHMDTCKKDFILQEIPLFMIYSLMLEQLFPYMRGNYYKGSLSYMSS